MTDPVSLVHACALDQRGGCRPLDWDDLRAETQNDPVWVHLDRRAEGTERWLRDEAGLSPLVCDALLADETRPRHVVIDDGAVVILRGVNLNPGADPEDMVSLRIWVDARRLISLRSRRVMAVGDIRDDLLAGHGPCDIGGLLSELADRLIERMAPVIEGLDEEIDEVDAVASAPRADIPRQRARLAELRRQAITLRRYLAPQRDTLSRLQIERISWLGSDPRARLREASDRLLRYVEDLDAAREQALVTRDELSSRLSEQMNRTMYILSMVATIFLPLGLLTGLLGINVGGIPGTESRWAFSIVCAVLAVLAGIELWAMRRMRPP